MEFVFVGAGRLATNMAKALSAKGHSVTAVYSRTFESAQALASLVDAQPTDDIRQLPLEADAFVIAVKDSAIADVLMPLREGRERQVFFHTSGSMPLNILAVQEHHGVIYPMQTFSKERSVDFSQVPFFIEGSDDATLALARQTALLLSQHVEERSSEDRRYLHLAAVFACNFTNHCYALAAQVLEKHGMTFDVLLPLIAETAAKAAEMHPREAQTGPAVRFDQNTIDAHLNLLTDSPMAQEVYRLLSQSIYQFNENK